MEAVAPKRLAGRALAALLLWLGFWAFALALVGALAWVPFAEAEYTGAPGVGGWVAGLLAITLLYALRPRGWFKRAEPEPPPLSREEFPKLYAFVDEVAARVGVKPPKALLLVGGPTAFANETRRWLGLRRERRVGIGLPLFAVLSRDELAAVICHELAHHAAGDVGLGPWVYRTRKAIGTAISELDGSAFFLDLPFRGYGALFLRVSGSVSRAQETAADALAARTWGAAALARSLEKVDVLAPLWSAYLEHEVHAFLGLGARVPILEGFRRFLVERAFRPEIAADLERSEDATTSPWDTHPSLAQRLAAVGEKARAPGLDQANCLELVGGESVAEEALYARWCENLPPRFAWSELAEKIVLPARRKVLQPLRLPDATGLAALPRWIADGAELWDRFRGASLDLLSPEAKRRRARKILADWVTVTLVDVGFTLQLSPGARPVLVRGEERIDPAAWIDRLASGELSADEHRTWAQTLEAKRDLAV